MKRFAVIFLTLGTLIASPSSAEILFVCGNPNVSDAEASRGGHALRNFELQPVSAMPRPQMNGDQIALWKGEDGFDLLINWNQAEEFSLKKSGANVVANAFGVDFVHLLVAYPEQPAIEHFIFAAEPDGFGNLIWTRGPADDETQANSASLQSSAMCVTP